MTLFDVYPLQDITITKAQGSYVWDENGVQYLDLYGGHAVISIGHTHPHWVKRIEEQMQKISFYSNSVQIPLQRELAEKLGKLSGKENYQLFLCNSGAEANENAFKLASFHTGKKKIVAFSKAFHGRTSLAVAATDNPKIVAPVNETNNIDFLPFNDEVALKKYFDEKGSEVSAVVVEAVQGVGGINVANEKFLQLIRKLCDDYNAVFIADEVQCGYGRTGKFFALDHAGINADIYTMAKGMGNGFPIGGILITEAIRPAHGMLGTTFGGNHLACAAALAVLEVMEKENLVEMAKQRGMYLINKLKNIDDIENVRGKGLMIGFDDIECAWQGYDRLDVPDGIRDLRKKLLSDHFLFTGEAKPNVVRLLPALNVTRKQVEEFLEGLTDAIEELKAESKDRDESVTLSKAY